MKDLIRRIIYWLYFRKKTNEYYMQKMLKRKELEATTVKKVLLFPKLYMKIFEGYDDRIKRAWIEEFAHRTMEVFQKNNP